MVVPVTLTEEPSYAEQFISLTILLLLNAEKSPFCIYAHISPEPPYSVNVPP